MSRIRAKLVAAAVVSVLAVGVASATALGLPRLTASSTRTATSGVVVVNTQFAYGGAGAGTGIVLSSSGEVLTNNHVIRGARTVRVTVPSTGRTYSATVLGYSVARDVALLRLNGATGLQTAAFGDTARTGDRVVAVGNAGGTGVLRLKSGRVVRLGRTITVTDDDGTTARLTGLIQTSAPLQPGDSGGPLLLDGKVIGMDAAASRTYEFDSTSGEGYAIPVDTVVRIARQIEAGRRTSNVHVGATAFLGVSLGDDGPYARGGALVHGVAAGSPAARAGLAEGDVITSFGNHRVTSSTQLRTLVLRMSPGALVRIRWSNDFASSQTATVRLASGPPQ